MEAGTDREIYIYIMWCAGVCSTSHTFYIKKAQVMCISLSTYMYVWLELTFCRWLPSFFTHQKGKIWLPVSTSTWAQNGSTSHRSPQGLLNQSWWLSLEMNPTKSLIWCDLYTLLHGNQSKLLIQFGSHHKKRIEQKPSAIRPKPHLPHQNFTVELHVTDATFQLPIREKLRDDVGSRNFQSNKKTPGRVLLVVTNAKWQWFPMISMIFNDFQWFTCLHLCQLSCQRWTLEIS